MSDTPNVIPVLKIEDLREAAQISRDATDYWHAELLELAAIEIERTRGIADAAKAYGSACRAFFAAAEACDYCDHDDPRDACTEHMHLAGDINHARTKLLELACKPIETKG